MIIELFNMEPRYASRHLNFGSWYHCEVPAGGQRVIWDGGVTRGQKCPWDAGNFPVTGVYSSDGYVVSLPDSFLNQLPCTPLDGFLYTDSGQMCFGVVGLPAGGRLLKVGDRLAGGRIITINPDRLKDCVKGSPYVDEWSSLPGGPQAVTFGYELSRMESATEGGVCHPLAFRKTDNHDVHTRIAMGKRLFLRHESSAWCTSFSSMCATTDYTSQELATVERVSMGAIHTNLGSYRTNGDPPVKRWEKVNVFINSSGFITGYHAT